MEFKSLRVVSFLVLLVFSIHQISYAYPIIPVIASISATQKADSSLGEENHHFVAVKPESTRTFPRLPVGRQKCQVKFEPGTSGNVPDSDYC